MIALQMWVVDGVEQDVEDQRQLEDVAVVVVHKESPQEVGGNLVQGGMGQSRLGESPKELEASCRAEHTIVGE